MTTVYVRAEVPRQAIAKAKKKARMPHGRVAEIKYIRKRGVWKVVLR